MAENEKFEETCAEEIEQETPAEPTAEDRLKEAEDKFLRLAAEYDNYRKRTAKEREGLYAAATGDVILALLDFVDDFERAAEAPCADEGYKKGIDLVGKKLYDFLKNMKVEEIDTEGGFNPELHNAIMHEENEDMPENVIGQVLRKGYTCGGRVIRHSLVKVIN